MGTWMKTMSSLPIKLDLSRIAHDLRGPLMPLRTAAWLLRNENVEAPRLTDLADIVDRQSVRLARMLDELSEWGRLQEKETTLTCEPVDLALTVDNALGSLTGCRSDPIITEQAAAFPLNGDMHRLAQLLRTLIEHATQRDPDHRPQITFRVACAQLEIRVQDQGKPLEPGERQDLLHHPQPRPFDDGLGLRFLLARMIAEAHGGTLEVDENVEHGLAIICALPPAQ